VDKKLQSKRLPEKGSLFTFNGKKLHKGKAARRKIFDFQCPLMGAARFKETGTAAPPQLPHRPCQN